MLARKIKKIKTKLKAPVNFFFFVVCLRSNTKKEISGALHSPPLEWWN
jgi:hypothetical protein